MKCTFASCAKSGSATIEASLVIPLLIFIIVGIIKIAGVREVRVRENSTENIKSTLEYLKDDATNPEDLLRLRWTAGFGVVSGLDGTASGIGAGAAGF